MSLLTITQVQFATGEEISELIHLLNKRGVNLNVYLVLDKEDRPVQAFVYPEHAAQYTNSTLQTGLTVKEMRVWWSNLKPTEHDADRPSMPQS